MTEDPIESCWLLVGQLLDHTALHERTDPAFGNFPSSADAGAMVLRHIINAQDVVQREHSG
jgi:hypothetical protein